MAMMGDEAASDRGDVGADRGDVDRGDVDRSDVDVVTEGTAAPPRVASGKLERQRESQKSSGV